MSPNESRLETARRFTLLKLLAFVGIAALTENGLTALRVGSRLLGIVDLAVVPLFAAILVMALRKRCLEFCCTAGTTILGVLTLFLAWHGGGERSAVLWTFTFPPIALNLLGPGKGAVFSGGSLRSPAGHTEIAGTLR